VLIFIGAAMGGRRGDVPGGIFIGIAYLVMGAIYLFPAGYLNRFASRIRALDGMRRMIDLEEALDAQRAFWRFCGIIAIVVVAIYLIVIAFLVFSRI